MKYKVPFSVTCYVTVEVEAENKEEAINLADDEVHLSGYCGNGGNDKLIGVYGKNLSVEAGEGFRPLESEIKEVE